MTIRPRALTAAALLLPALAAPAPAVTPLPTPRSVRITMQALHENGGVPPGWELRLQAGDVLGGRQLFFTQGCHKCHVVKGANLPAVPPDEVDVGPELTGMGKHHPPAYFLESIVNPSAVLVEGPGYLDETGRSRMPAYLDLTAVQLQDLVAFLSSLTAGEAAHDFPTLAPGSLTPTPAPPPTPAHPLPAPSAAPATLFLVQTYDINDGQLAAFEQWFRDELAPRMRAFPGVVGVETYVDTTRRGASVSTLFGFRDRAAYDRWNNNLRMRELATKFDQFIGLHGHVVYESAPIYRAPSLSTESEPPR